MTVTISNAAAGELAWTATRLGSSPWLSLAAASGTAPGTLDATADPRGLAAGVYEDTIVVVARSPARGEARVAIQFVIHPCRLGETLLNVELTGRLDGADCGGPHRSTRFADLFSFAGTAGDSVSIELESADFAPYLILDSAGGSSASPLVETGLCAYAAGVTCLRYQRLPRTGTFVIEVTTAVAGDSGAYRLRLFRPRPPSPVDSIAQLSGDSTTAIATGGVIADSTIVLRGTASDPDGGDSLRLEVEIRPVDTPFTGSPTIAGTFVPAGSRAFARVGVSDNTAYHWRARVVDQTGRASSWSDFGGNAGSSPDLSVAVNDSPSAPTELGQFRGDGLAAIAVGSLTDEPTTVMKGTVFDPDASDSVRLEVEVQAVGTPFTGAPTSTSALVPSGAIAVVTVVGLTDETLYHWQARAVDRSGRATAWSAFGDNGDVGIDFFVSLLKAPALPSAMGQFRIDGVTAVGPADTIPERSIRLHAMLTDLNFGDQLRLEVEVQPAGTPFIEAASGSSLPVASGEVASVVIGGLPENTSYHWQARVVDQSGHASAWTAFSNNSGATPDFHIRVPATQLAFLVQPGTTGSGTALAPAVQVAAQDGEGNTLASFTAPIAIALGSNPAGGTLAGTVTVNAVAGIATFTDIRIDRAGSGYSLVASATGPAPATSAAFGITPGAAVRLAILTQPPDTARSGQAFSRHPMVQLLDAAGNAVSQSGATVDATIGSGGGVLNGTTAVLTNADGIAVFTDLSLSGLVGSRTLVFDGPELAGAISSTVHVTAGTPSTVIMSAGNGQSASAGTAVALPPAVLVQDASGNPVSGVAVTFAAGPGNGSVSPLTPVLTNASGIAEATSWTLGTTVGTDSVTATTSWPLIGPVVFISTVTAGAPSQMSLAGGDNQVDTVGQTLPTALAVRIADQFDNPVTNVPIGWAVLDGAGTVNPPSSFTDANGIATTNWTLGTAMTQADSAQSLQASWAGSSVTFTAVTVPGPVSANQTSVTAFPTTIGASSGGSASTVTIIVRDQFGNVIKGKTAVLAATGTGNELTQPATTSDVNGVVTGLLSATVAESKTVSVTIDGTEITQTAAVTVRPAEVSAGLSTVIASPGTLAASEGADRATITVTARDVFGNPIDGATVVLAAAGSGTALAQPLATTDVNGLATGTLSATAAGNKVVSATINGTEIIETATVTVGPAGIDATQSTVIAAPGPITAGSGVASITVTARDAFGNPVTGATVLLAATGTGNTLTQPAATTDGAGVATGTLAATGAGNKIVSATINGMDMTQTSTVIVTPAEVSAAQSGVTSAPSSIIASNGVSSATISVTARDAFGNAIEGATVLLAATGTGNAVTQPGPTDASGTATGALSATVAGERVVSVTIDGTGIAQTTAVTVTPAGVSAAQSSVTAQPGALTASTGTSSATISIIARDQFGNPIQGATVELAATGSGNTLTQPAGPTDPSGTATGVLSSTWAEAKTVSATVGGTGITQTAIVTVAPAVVSGGQSTVSVSPSTITASDGSSSATITVTARDEFGNPIQGATVVLAATGVGNTVTQPELATAASGVATGSLSATVAGGKIVSITIDGTVVAQTAAITVTPAELSTAQSTVAVAPGTIEASTGASSAVITVTARDAFGNAIAGVPVLLAATGNGNVLTQPGTTDASGTTTGVLSATVAESKTLSVTIGGTAITQTANVIVVPANISATQSTVIAAPDVIVASGGENGATITVTARDQFGNLIAGAPVVLTATGSGHTLTQPTTTNAAGVATGTLTATAASEKVVLATIGGTGISQTAMVTVTPGGVSAAQSTVAATPAAIIASTGASSATITVTARDQFGNPIEGAAVALAATGPGNTVNQPGATTDANGVASGTLSATGTGDKVVSATINGTQITETATVTVEPAEADATQSTVMVTPGSITAGSGVSTITVTARDQFGNPINGASVVLAASGTGNSLTQPGTTTDASGVAIGFLTATGAGDKVVSATIGGTGVTQTPIVTVTPAGVSAAQSTVTAAPATVVASTGASSATITVTARDEFGNPIPGAAVTLAATGSGNALTQPELATNASGVATGSLSATAAESKVVSVTIDGTGVAQTVTIAVTAGPVSAVQSTVVAGPGSITAGSGVAAVTVTARDQFGNPIGGAAVVLAASGSGNSVIQPATTTDANGIATGTLSATVAGGKTVSAMIDGTGIVQTATVTVTPAGVSAAQSSLTTTAGALIASNGTSSASITVTARDEFGNPIPGATVVLAASGSGNSLVQPATTTDANGIATGTLSATVAEEKVVSATIDGTGVTQTAAVSVTAAGVSAGQSTLVVTPETITASAGTNTGSITVIARDQFGNPIAGATVVLAASGSGNSVIQPATTTDANGIATGTLSATVAEAKVVSATINGTGVAQTTAVTVMPAAVSAAQSSVTALPGTIAASSGASSASITVTARDEFGNPIPGATAVLAATGSGNTVTQPELTTGASGVATGSLSATVAEPKIVSATINGTLLTQTAALSVTPAELSAGQSTVVVTAGTIEASTGASSTAIIVTARDAFGNPIEGAAVVLAATGTGNTLTQPGVTDASGVATGALSATVAEGKTVAATINGTGITQTAAVTVMPASVSGGQSTVTVAPGSIVASGGENGATITVTARDQFGNLIEGAPVMLTASGAGNTVTQPATTDVTGVATGTLSSTAVGDKVVLATIGGTAITQTATVRVTSAGVSATQSTVAATPAAIIASSGASSATITVTARDQFGNPIDGAAVVVTASGSGNAIIQPATTSATGVATASLSATVAEAKIVSVAIDGTAITQTAAVTVTPAAVSAAQSTLTAATAAITASTGASSAPIIVTARDQFGNPIQGATVVLAASGTGNALTQPGTTTDATGTATGTLSATGAGDKSVSATIDGTGVTQTATVTVAAAGVSPVQSTVTALPGSITAGSDIATIAVTARDQFGNPIQGATVVLAATGNGNTLTQPAGPTDASGATTATLSSTAAATKTVSAAIDGTAIPQTAMVTVTPAGVSAVQSTVTASPSTIPASAGANTGTITVIARDQFGNPIEGAVVVLAASGTGNSLTQPAPTDATGSAIGALSATVAEEKIVSATIDGTGVTQTATVGVVAAAVSGAQSTVTAAPDTITASDGTSSTTISVTARDAFGNPIQGATVVLAATAGGNTLTQPATTDGTGLTTGTLSATVAGDRIVTASINGTDISQSATITVSPAGVSAAQSTLTAAPGTLTASTGASSATITVMARDQFGNPIQGATVVLAATGTGNALTQPPTTTGANGIATGTLSATTAEMKTITASIAGLAITQQASVLVTPATASELVFLVQPTGVTAGAPITPPVQVEIRDEFANRVTSATNVALTIATNPGGGTLTGGGAVAAVDGVASFAGLILETAGSGYTLEASSPGLSGATSAGFTVTPGAVSSAQSTMDVAPASITAGSGVATITVTARDAFGNPIAGAAVALTATGTGNTLTQPAATTDANGAATGTLTATGAGEKVISATIAGTGVTQTAAVTVQPAGVDPVQSTMLVAPETITASNGSSSTTITVTARDQFGNPIEGATVVLGASGSGNSLTQPAATTAANGIATGTLSATVAETKTVTASVDGMVITQQASVLVTPADADHLAFLVQPTDVTADATITPTVEVEIRDPFANRVTGATNEVALAIASNPGAGTLTGGGSVAAVNGVASFAAINVNKAGAGYTLAAASPGLTGATSVLFTVAPGAVSALQSTVSAAPASIPVGSGATSITVTARDANDNPIPGATVVLAAAGTATVLTQPVAPTAADGTATGTLSATLSGGKVVSAVINGTPIAQTAIVAVQPPAGSVVLVGAGDIGDCLTTTDEATAAILDTIPGTVFTAGDNAYPDGTADDFTNCYDPTWGRHKARTRPSPGNHEYRQPSAAPYYAYFGASAGSGGWGFYSYDLGDWHIISLNSEIGMSVGSAQETWLRSDLAANTKACTLAYWHKPRYSSGEHGSLVKSQPIWRALQEYDAEVVVVAHDHNYERFAPQDTLGVADPDSGLRQFVVGTGGTELRAMNAPVANSEVRNNDTHGVLKLTLYSTGYEWEFVPIAGKTFTDSGSGTCH